MSTPKLMNKHILKIHKEILDNKRQALLRKIIPYVNSYILGGGTALALQLAHRKSFDFDFFSSSPISKKFLEKISKDIGVGSVSIDSPDELTFFTKNGIKLTFLYYPFSYAFPLLTLENGLSFFSINDIAIKKAYTIGRRGEYRDYFDLYTILKLRYIDLPALITETKKIYGSIFEEKIFLEQLVYFEDLLNFDIVPVSANPIPTPEKVEHFFEDLVKQYV